MTNTFLAPPSTFAASSATAPVEFHSPCGSVSSDSASRPSVALASVIGAASTGSGKTDRSLVAFDGSTRVAFDPEVPRRFGITRCGEWSRCSAGTDETLTERTSRESLALLPRQGRSEQHIIHYNDFITLQTLDGLDGLGHSQAVARAQPSGYLILPSCFVFSAV